MKAILPEDVVLENDLVAEKKAYREASRTFDVFVTGVSAALLIAGLGLCSSDSGIFAANVIELVAISLFSLALIAGIRKLEQTLTVLGASCAILEAETNAGAGGAVVDELSEAIQAVSLKAAKAHRFRNWFLVAGIVVFVVAKAIAAVLAA